MGNKLLPAVVQALGLVIAAAILGGSLSSSSASVSKSASESAAAAKEFLPAANKAAAGIKSLGSGAVVVANTATRPWLKWFDPFRRCAPCGVWAAGCSNALEARTGIAVAAS